MCTVTWLRSDSGYELFCNRDESHARPPARPPAVIESGPLPYVAPTDPQAGGTWIGTNAKGLTLCMLNYYADGVSYQPPSRQSRGLLLTSLLSCTTPRSAVDTARETPLDPYPPFLLLAVSHVEPALTLRWDGRSAEIAPCQDNQQPVTTCSVDTARVLESRRNAYRRLLETSPHPGADDLAAYHAGHDPEPSAYSVCTHRDDARSLSISHVIVTAEDVQFRYAGCPPCEATPEDFVTTGLRRT